MNEVIHPLGRKASDLLAFLLAAAPSASTTVLNPSKWLQFFTYFLLNYEWKHG